VKKLNFTQFCIQHGFPTDHDTMFDAQLLGSRSLAGRVSKHAIKQQDEAFHAALAKNKEAHRLFREAVRNGDVVDADGKITREGLIAAESARQQAEIQSKITALKRYIETVRGLGPMSHAANGKLKAKYRRAVEVNEAEIARLEGELQQNEPA
jgi:hypothetical protein